MASARRILYVDLAPSVGGSVISLYQLVKGLDRQRYEPHIVLRASNDYRSRFCDLGVPVTTLAGQGSTATAPEMGTWSSVRSSRLTHWLKRSTWGEGFVHMVGFYLRTYPGLRHEAQALVTVMRTVQPDLVHLNDVVCVSRSGIMAARRVGVPAICHLRAIAGRTHFDRWLSRSVCGYICISRAVERYESTLGGRVEPSWIVYNGLDPEEFVPQDDAMTTRAELGFAPDDAVIGCIGRLVAWKGQEVFLRALAQVATGYPRLRGLVVGAPEAHGQAYVESLRALARALGLEKRVIFTGFRGDIPRLLRAMDVLVHASTAPEPFGRVLIEGMAAGTAIIGADAGAVPEIITDGVTGLLVPPGDAEALARALGRLLDSPQERQALCWAARRVVAERFTSARYVRDVECIYEELLN